MGKAGKMLGTCGKMWENAGKCWENAGKMRISTNFHGDHMEMIGIYTMKYTMNSSTETMNSSNGIRTNTNQKNLCFGCV